MRKVRKCYYEGRALPVVRTPTFRGSENLVPDQPLIPGPWVDDTEPEEASTASPQAVPPPQSAPPPPVFPQAQQQQRHPEPPPAPLTRAERRAPTRTEQMLERFNAGDEAMVRPEKGFRRLVYDLTNGRINPGLSKDALLRQSLIRTLTAPLPAGRVFHVGCFTQKGGLGKTTTATALGATMGTYRNDKVLGLDVNPDGGSMALRVPLTSDRWVLDLRDELLRRDLSPMEFDSFVNHNPRTRFDAIVLPPGEKPASPLTADDYRLISSALYEKYPYRIVFVDCGTDLTSSVMDGVIPRLDLLVTVTSTIRDEATVTMGGLDALAKDGYADLVSNSVTMMIHKQLDDPDVQEQRKIDQDTREIRSEFREATRAVVDVPYDSVLRRGKIIDLNEIGEEAQVAYLRGAAEITTALSELG